jgi:hypothetical protein
METSYNKKNRFWYALSIHGGFRREAAEQVAEATPPVVHLGDEIIHSEAARGAMICTN